MSSTAKGLDGERLASSSQNNKYNHMVYGSIVASSSDHDEEAELNGRIAADPSSTSSPLKRIFLVSTAVLLVTAVGITASRKEQVDSNINTVAYGGNSGVLNMLSSIHRSPREGSSVSLSSLSPEGDLLGLQGIDRDDTDAGPSAIWGSKLLEKMPLPTNSWYLNLISRYAGTEQPNDATRAYTIPYIIDTAPTDAMTGGIRIHWPVLQASDRNMQMVYDANAGLHLGTMDRKSLKKKKHYTVSEKEDLSLLGVSLSWGDAIKTHIVRGMPYATMRYFRGVLPSIVSYKKLASSPLIDGSTELQCGDLKGDSDDGENIVVAQKEVELQFKGSDFTWAIFFSKPVKLRCSAISQANESRGPGVVAGVAFQLDVVSYEHSDGGELTVRAALINPCTTGNSDTPTHCKKTNQWKDREGYMQLLKESAHMFPASPTLDIDYPSDGEDDGEAVISFDWDVQNSAGSDTENSERMIIFALPHHQKLIDSSAVVTTHCIPTFHGSTCLVKGNTWSLVEPFGSPQSFVANRPPEPWAIPALAEALSKDIKYKLPANLFKGAADTYFSGKTLARVARTIIVATEMNELAASNAKDGVPDIYTGVDPTSYALAVEAAKEENFPSDADIQNAVEQLKLAVQVWVDGTAKSPYVYDRTWGGMVNCGCTYKGHADQGTCVNAFPNCPALTDVNVDFGNGYYNDHHFHYGYHVYAAAVAAKYDPEWGRNVFDGILLYIRDIATPDPDDEFFTQFRQKDWFLGSSWASGIISAENSPHGRNQESSSEAIAAYEGVALFGAVMMDAFSNTPSMKEKLEAAKLVRNLGQLLTVTEVNAARRYWHVSPNSTAYPSEYKQPVVGMLYETMASFQTWFAPWAFVSYGIQLLPLTPIAGIRDDPEWPALLYPMYEKDCLARESFCVDNGWTIIECGLLATAGRPREAFEKALLIPSKVFNSEGGVGNSLSNTIWYISTRAA